MREIKLTKQDRPHIKSLDIFMDMFKDMMQSVIAETREITEAEVRASMQRHFNGKLKEFDNGLTYPEAMKMLNCGKTKLASLLENGDIKKLNSPGRKKLISENSIHKFLDK